jgi:hypothetical protein
MASGDHSVSFITSGIPTEKFSAFFKKKTVNKVAIVERLQRRNPSCPNLFQLVYKM